MIIYTGSETLCETALLAKGQKKARRKKKTRNNNNNNKVVAIICRCIEKERKENESKEREQTIEHDK